MTRCCLEDLELPTQAQPVPKERHGERVLELRIRKAVQGDKGSPVHSLRQEDSPVFGEPDPIFQPLDDLHDAPGGDLGGK